MTIPLLKNQPHSIQRHFSSFKTAMISEQKQKEFSVNNLGKISQSVSQLNIARSSTWAPRTMRISYQSLVCSVTAEVKFGSPHVAAKNHIVVEKFPLSCLVGIPTKMFSQARGIFRVVLFYHLHRHCRRCTTTTPGICPLVSRSWLSWTSWHHSRFPL